MPCVAARCRARRPAPCGDRPALPNCQHRAMRIDAVEMETGRRLPADDAEELGPRARGLIAGAAVGVHRGCARLLVSMLVLSSATTSPTRPSSARSRWRSGRPEKRPASPPSSRVGRCAWALTDSARSVLAGSRIERPVGRRSGRRDRRPGSRVRHEARPRAGGGRGRAGGTIATAGRGAAGARRLALGGADARGGRAGPWSTASRRRSAPAAERSA